MKQLARNAADPGIRPGVVSPSVGGVVGPLSDDLAARFADVQRGNSSIGRGHHAHPFEKVGSSVVPPFCRRRL